MTSSFNKLTVTSSKKKVQKTINDDLQTQTSKNQYKSQTSSKIQATTMADKKDKSCLGYINEKLTQWPLWNKITSYVLNQPEQKKIEPVKETQNIVISKRKPMKIKQVPWKFFYSRGHIQYIYDYYHCKQDNTTYFYMVKQQFLSHERQIIQMCNQLDAPLPDDKFKYFYAVPTDIAKQQLEKELAAYKQYKNT